MDSRQPEREGAAAQPGGRRRRPAEPPKQKEPSALRDRVSPRTAARTRRAVTFLLGVWCGGLLLVALVAPASFRAAEAVLQAPPPAVETIAADSGAAVARAALRYQVGEVNRGMFAIWGWTQAALAAAVLILLVFLSDADRFAVGVAALMLALAGVVSLLLIPRISALTRAAALVKPGGASTESFAALHAGFGIFQLALVALIAILFFLLFRRRRAGGQGL